MCAGDGREQWRVVGGRRPRPNKAGGHRKSEITKIEML